MAIGTLNSGATFENLTGGEILISTTSPGTGIGQQDSAVLNDHGLIRETEHTGVTCLPGWSDFHGQQCRNETHVSSTDPEARLAKKARGQEARLSFAGHLLTDNRSGLILDVLITPATGIAERKAALQMLDRQRTSRKRATLAADRGYDTRAFVKALRERALTPHVAQNCSGNRRSAIDARTTRHTGYRQSQRECFGWIKTVGGGRKLRYVGCAKNQLLGHLRRSRLQPGPYGQARSPDHLNQRS